MIIVSSGTGTVTNINTTAPLSGGPITTSGTITTAMATNKLIGRSTAGTGTMEEITVGTGLSLSGGTLSSTASGAAGNTNEIQFNNAAAFAASANLRWIISDNRLLLGTENTADTNSRMVVIGKGISTQNTFVVHNQTGTNNALVVRDDTRVGIATATPAATLSIGTIHNFSLTGSGGSAIFGSRLDQNSNTVWLIQNQTAGANAEALIAVRADSSLFTTLSQTSSTYTNNYNGSEGRSGVLYTKSNDTNAAKQKFAISNTSSAATNKFEWISAVATTGTLSNGFGTISPIMTLVGNGNLLLGTTSEGASATKTIVINNGTAPSGNVTDSFQQYSADIVPGNAAPHFRTENGNIIKVYQETTGVGSATLVSGAGGSAKHDDTYDGYTLAQIVKALRNQGLLA